MRPVINEFVSDHTGADTSEFVEVLGGPLTDLSADSLVDPGSKALYFAVPDSEVARLNDKVLQPGMPADVLILTGQRTPMDCLIKPIKESMNKAWREN